MSCGGGGSRAMLQLMALIMTCVITIRHVTATQTDEVDNWDNMITNTEEPATSEDWSYHPTPWDERRDLSSIQTKRLITVFRTRPPKSEGYKRGPGFRSWGGKRAGLYIPELYYNFKRRPFQSWGGKRTDVASKKKQTFNSWGGKRSYYPD